MKLTILLSFIVLLTMSACGGNGTQSNSAVVDTPVNTVTDTSGSGNSAGSGPINSVFNGYMLSGAVIRGEDGFSNSSRFYRYDSDQNTITYSGSSGINVSAENARLRRTIELDNNGLPKKITRFSRDEAVLIDNHRFNATGRLESRDFEYPLTGDAPRKNNYSYNANGQLLSERTYISATGFEMSNTDYTYTADGLLNNSTSYLPVNTRIVSTDFSSDQSDRLSGWREENMIGNYVNTASYTYDENNNIVTVEIYDGSGLLTRTLNYSYVETTTPVYNMIWFDYLYSPKIE